MKVTLVVATSLDGKITMGDNPDVHAWTSPEDTEHFRSFIQSASLIVMGRKTYDEMKGTMKHKPGRLRLVLTRNPERYKTQEIPGLLEFINSSPLQLINKLKPREYKEMLLVSGSEVTTAFFKAELIDEVYLTLEPWIFGAGKPVVLSKELNIKLQLIRMKKLNEKGTLLLHYIVQH